MSYVESNLISGEAITYRGRLHWIVLFRPFVLALLFGLAGGGLVFLGKTHADQYANLLLGVGVVLLVLAAIFLITGFLVRNSAEFAVTNKRVILKSGMVERRTVEMFLNKIESVGVSQTIWGRIFNYGTMVLHGTGGTAEPFDRVARPLEFRRQVQDQISRTTGQI